jgi:hypothetical protein
MANKYMKLFSTLAIKEMQIKTVSRFYVTPVRMMIINKNTPSKKKNPTTNAGEEVGRKEILIYYWREIKLVQPL